MEKNLMPELKSLKEEFDFLHKKIGELEWELATIFYDRKAVRGIEIETVEALSQRQFYLRRGSFGCTMAKEKRFSYIKKKGAAVREILHDFTVQGGKMYQR